MCKIRHRAPTWRSWARCSVWLGYWHFAWGCSACKMTPLQEFHTEGEDASVVGLAFICTHTQAHAGAWHTKTSAPCLSFKYQEIVLLRLFVFFITWGVLGWGRFFGQPYTLFWPCPLAWMDPLAGLYSWHSLTWLCNSEPLSAADLTWRVKRHVVYQQDWGWVQHYAKH